jgi:hypothetical protein
MTTINKRNPAPITRILGKDCRYVKIDNRKFLYYSDLIKIAGKDFLKELRTSPIIQRVSDGANSQDRKLVNVTDFRNAHKQAKEKTKLKKTPKVKAVRHEAEQFCFPFESSNENKCVVSSKLQDSSCKKEILDLASIKVDTSSIKPIHQQGDAKDSLVKSQINGIVHKYVNTQIVENGFVDDSAEACTLRMNAYASLYTQFDTVYSAALAEHNLDMEAVGLGANVRYKSGYMDILAEKKLLPILLTVAKQFFSIDTKRKARSKDDDNINLD